MSGPETANAVYEKELEEAATTDLTLVRGKQIVHIARNEDGSPGTDAEGCRVVMLTPSLVPNDPSAWDKAFKLFLLETQEVSTKTKSHRAIFTNSVHNGALLETVPNGWQTVIRYVKSGTE